MMVAYSVIDALVKSLKAGTRSWESYLVAGHLLTLRKAMGSIPCTGGESDLFSEFVYMLRKPQAQGHHWTPDTTASC